VNETIQTSRGTAVRVFLVALLIFHQPATTAVIVVDGGCTLADAITAANTDSVTGGCTAGAGADEIQLTADVVLTTRLPRIQSDVTLEGNDLSVSRDAAAPDFGIFSVSKDGGPFVLRSTSVSNGRAVNGGGIAVGEDATVEITYATLTQNEATQNGGAVYLRYNASATITNSTLSYNTAGNNGGAIFGYDNTYALIVESSLLNNSAYAGGATYFGWEDDSLVLNSTLSGNSATKGGGIYTGFDVYANITNSTVSGNSAETRGGGVYNGYGYSGTYLFNTTIFGNSGTQGSNIYGAFFSGAVRLYSSIVASPVGHYNCSGYNFSDFGDNFDDDGSCPGTSLITPGVDLDPTLADNGGPTQTHALLAGSVAIDAAGACGLATDQRGQPRDDGSCDSGSFEFGAAGVGGSVGGIQARQVRCLNVTTSQSIAFALSSESDWDCEAQGLVVGSGDAIRQSVLGKAIDGASGSVRGITPGGARCRNLTTGQSVPVPLTTDSWDCVAEGLVVNTGDRIEQQVEGTAP